MNRLTNFEWNDLKAVASTHGINLSDMVREAFSHKDYNTMLTFFAMATRYNWGGRHGNV